MIQYIICLEDGGISVEIWQVTLCTSKQGDNAVSNLLPAPPPLLMQRSVTCTGTHSRPVFKEDNAIGFLLLYAMRSGKCRLLYIGFKSFHMAISATMIKLLIVKLNKLNSYSIWYINVCTTPTNIIYLPLKTPPLYTYVCQLWVMSDLVVIPLTDPQPTSILMANSH